MSWALSSFSIWCTRNDDWYGHEQNEQPLAGEQIKQSWWKLNVGTELHIHKRTEKHKKHEFTVAHKTGCQRTARTRRLHKKNFLITLLNASVSDSVCVYLITEKRFESFMSLKINEGKKKERKKKKKPWPRSVCSGCFDFRATRLFCSCTCWHFAIKKKRKKKAVTWGCWKKLITKRIKGAEGMMEKKEQKRKKDQKSEKSG